MFGFFSLLPFSTLESVYYNGRDHDLILHIQQQQDSISCIQSTILLDMTLQKSEGIIL
jgi:hypothetical protein